MRMELATLAARLDAAEERMNLAQKATGLGIWDWNIATGELLWDENMFELFPCAKHTYNYDMFINAVVEEDRPKINDGIEAAMHGAPYDFSFRVYHHDGTTGRVRGNGKVVEWNNGKASRMIGVCLKAE